MSRDTILVEANPSLLFTGVDDPGFDGAVIRELDPLSPQLSIFDLGFIRGDGIFEATSVVDGVPLAIRLHIARLARSARLVDMPELTGEQAWLDATYAALDVYGRTAPATIRILASRGTDDSTAAGRRGNPGAPSVFIYVDTDTKKRKSSQTATLLTRGYPLETLLTADQHPWLLLGAKTLSYAQNMAVYREVERRGVDLGIYTTTDGYVLEAATSTIAILRNGELKTSTPDVGILHGTTQQELFAFAEHEGIPHSYEVMTVEELMSADHVFNMGGSNMQVIESIDGTPFQTRPDFADLAVTFCRENRDYVENYTTGPDVPRWL